MKKGNVYFEWCFLKVLYIKLFLTCKLLESFKLFIDQKRGLIHKCTGKNLKFQEMVVWYGGGLGGGGGVLLGESGTLVQIRDIASL